MHTFANEYCDANARVHTAMFEQAFGCESQKENIEFMKRHGPQNMPIFTDVWQMGKDSGCYDAVTQTSMIVPWVMILIAGFSCKALSRRNVTSRKNGDQDATIKDHKGSTGLTWIGILTYLQEVQPFVFVGENVHNLMDHETELRAQLDDAGYQCVLVEKNSTRYGLPQERRRVYIVAIRNEVQNAPFREVLRIWASMEADAVDVTELISASRELVHAKRTKREKDTCKWINLHKNLFSDHGFKFEVPKDGVLSLSSLTSRERSVVDFNMQNGVSSGFQDISQSLDWFQAVFPHALPVVTPGARIYDYGSQELVPTLALWNAQGLDDGEEMWAGVAEDYSDSFLKDLAGNSFAIPVVGSLVVAVLATMKMPQTHADMVSTWFNNSSWNDNVVVKDEPEDGSSQIRMSSEDHNDEREVAECHFDMSQGSNASLDELDRIGNMCCGEAPHDVATRVRHDDRSS